ncbi:MAG: hypothetical protein LKG24_03995 [Lacticaseibacillus songhuajiangensis]|jgi:transcriptional regulator with XRE-family HTH domain|nr:hypothetical protein [Lacticaseibacillus songhuajiangensis]
MTNKFNLAAFLKRFRREHGITLRAAYPESPSTLSRMENEKNIVSASRLHEVMEREGLRYWDLQVHSNQYLSAFKEFFDEMILERFNPQPKHISEIVARYKSRTNGTELPIARINLAVVENIFLSIRTQQLTRLDEKMQKQIERLLLRNDDWIIYDYSLLRLCAQYLDTDRIIRCLTKARKQNQKQAGQYQQYYRILLEQCALILMLRHKSGIQELLEGELRKLRVEYFDGADAVTISFVLLHWESKEKAERGQSLPQLFESMQILKLVDMYRYYEKIESALKSGEEVIVI